MSPSPIKPWHLLMVGLTTLVLASVLLHPRQSTRAERKDLRILCTFLPMYVYTLNVVGDTPGVEVELLITANTGCPHDYVVRPADVRRVADADLIVANGLGLDTFLDPLVEHDRPDRVLMISDEHGLLHASEHEEHDAHEHGDANPHVWVSPELAVRQVRILTDKLAKADPVHAEAYRKNGEAYIKRLEGLLSTMRKTADGFVNRNIVTFHDAFAYLARDLHLNVVATLTEDPDHAPSAREITRMIDTIQEKKAAAIFYEPAYPDRLARTVARDTGVPLYPLNPVNSVEGAPNARTYETVMKHNLETLQLALGRKP